MAATLRFTKMQGIGNDYVYVNGFEERVENPNDLARQISDRHFGVGSDGLVLILPSGTSDVRMRMFNSDGSEAEMCGNAIRCVGKYVHDHGILSKDVIRVETRAGEKIVRLLFEGGEVCGATVDMGEPVLTPANIPVLVEGDTSAQRFVARPVEVDGAGYDITAVSMLLAPTFSSRRPIHMDRADRCPENPPKSLKAKEASPWWPSRLLKLLARSAAMWPLAYCWV